MEDIKIELEITGGFGASVKKLIREKSMGFVWVNYSHYKGEIVVETSSKKQSYMDADDLKVDFEGISFYCEPRIVGGFNIVTPFKSEVIHVPHPFFNSLNTVVIFSMDDFNEYIGRPDVFKPNDLVTYVPNHAKDKTDEVCENGIVSSVKLNKDKSQSVYVRYTSGGTAALTPTKNLIKR